MCDNNYGGKILVLCGKSGSGKDAIQREFVKMGYEPIVSTTTRPMRAGEIPGKSYHFVSRRTFSLLIEWDELIEYRSYHTINDGKPDVWYYGVRKFQPEPDTNYVVVLDFDGANGFLKYFGTWNCCVVYVDTSDDIRESRAKKRGSFDKAEWDRRLTADAEDFSADKTGKIAFASVDNNGELSVCVDKIKTVFDRFCRVI